MSSASPGDRIARRNPSVIDISTLEHADVVNALSALSRIFESAYGSRGHGKITHNDCGGHVTLTTCASRLLQSLSFTTPVVKLIHSALQDHLRVYSDGGCLTAILGLQLILRALDPHIHRRLFIEVYNLVLRVCEQYFQSDDCPCKLNVDFSRTDQLLKLISGLYTSKPCCLLFGEDLNHMCQVTLEGFLKTFPRETDRLNIGTGNLLYVTLEGQPVRETKLYEGVLFQTPQIPVYHKETLDFKTSSDGILLALVETTMAGDTDALLDVTYEISSEVKLSDAVLDRLIIFAEELVNFGVGLLACQRVVHPKVKKILKQEKVIVLDRLGKVHFKALHQTAGGQILNPFTPVPIGGAISRLQRVSHLVLHNKSYLQMIGCYGNSPICTLFMCHRSPEALAEMKEVCEASQSILGQMTRQPEALCGGGCWQTSLAHYLRYKLPSILLEWTDLLGCSESQLRQIFQTIISVMELPPHLLARTQHTVQLTDWSTGHHFQSPTQNESCEPIICQCGAVSYETISEMTCDHLDQVKSFTCSDVKGHADFNSCTIMDSFSASLGAIRDAFGISNMVLGINNYVKDVT